MQRAETSRGQPRAGSASFCVENRFWNNSLLSLSQYARIQTIEIMCEARSFLWYDTFCDRATPREFLRGQKGTPSPVCVYVQGDNLHCSPFSEEIPLSAIFIAALELHPFCLKRFPARKRNPIIGSDRETPRIWKIRRWPHKEHNSLTKRRSASKHSPKVSLSRSNSSFQNIFFKKKREKMTFFF